MNELQQYYLGSLSERREELERLRPEVSEVGEGASKPDTVEAIRRIAHRLKGTGGSYGFPEVSESAARLEEAAEVFEGASEEAGSNKLLPALDHFLGVLSGLLQTGEGLGEVGSTSG